MCEGQVFDVAGDFKYPQFFAHFGERIRKTYPALENKNL
jgi:hypothetical protein